MKRELKFTLQNLTTSEVYNAHPIYADDISIVSEKESGQVFFREKLSTQLTFVGADYSWIMAQAFDDAILLILSIKENGVLVKTWYGKLMRTDCAINEIDTIIRVTPEPRDYFNDILSIMDREINIKDLDIANRQIYMPTFDVVQLYKPNSSSITNYVNGEIWSVDVSREISRHSDLTDLYFYNTFGWLRPRLYSGITATFAMQSYVRTYQSAVTLTMTDTTSTYTLNVSISESNSCSVTLKQGGTVLGDYDGINDNGIIKDADDNPICYFSLSHTPIYSRYLSASSGSAAINDFGAIGKNYKHVTPLTSLNRHGLQLGISTVFSNSPTQWGAVYTNGTPTGQYYAPHAWFGYDALPFMQNYWSGDGSIWFMILKAESTNIPYSQMLIADCYEIGDLINAILSSQNVGIVLPKNSVGSEFLYSGTSPISGWHNGYEIYFTAKSNVANFNADEPAASVKCTLGTVLNFLKNALNVRWTLVSGDLKVEHIAYFKNGGSYGSTPAIGYDLTTMINPRNNKPWAFGQNDYSFEKNKMPEFVKWEWMDETNLFFDGSGFNCISKYVQQGNTESINIANVTSNVGFIATRPDQITLDGLCVFLTVNDRINVGTCSRPTLGGVYNVANPEMAMWNLQQGVLLYDAPCDTIAVSDTTYNAVDAVLTKTNEVTFPALIVDVLKLIKTNVGDGVIDSITNNINNYNVKIKLLYGNE